MNPVFASRWLHAFLLPLMLVPTSGFALVCTSQSSGATEVHDSLSSTVAIPASLPDGEVVWRSEPLNIQVECAGDSLQSGEEEVFLYLNPDNQVIGQGIRAGLTLDASDHLQSSGRISTGHFLPACRESEASLGACPKVRFNLGFSVFIQKSGATPPSGVASHLTDYRFFQLGGSTGSDRLPGRSLSYVINNLSGLRFVACDAQLQVIPETVDFGDVGIQQIGVGKTLATQLFSLSTSRSCDSPFSIDARFRPVTGSVSGELLVPSNNDSVGIRIISAVSGNPLQYNQPFHLADLLGEAHAAQADFSAELVWNTPRPKSGPFEAEIMVDLFYK
ncbi:fimbrial protein [Pseudomonas syringae]|uniref:Fimbrial protein n=4 Tax=Pseudomonas syringae group TaxID=136849 RepID=A0A9Q4A4E0_PSESX|nr:fimbrial protein [Pseudomonas syringae]KTB59221.1 pilus assembly protein [Pseudomonas viridiflava ICMP 13104]KTB84872.1 pilus assembly protein [Pseudomonas syringae pv. syringae PD2766]MCF5467730.1 fimbrial protein [Pseudomonas syringae]MCF5474540.1 fimbrial protein [Pseudomonas syringae]MCF5484058.1 fimbrial protein [Pseudomonas syringae]